MINRPSISRASIALPPLAFQWGAALIALLCGVIITVQPQGTALILAAAILAICVLIAPIAAVWVLLILAPLRTLIETEAPGLLPIEIGILTTVLVFAVWTVHRVASGRRVIGSIFSPLLIPIGVFVLVMGLTGFAAASMGAWLNEWLKWGVIFALVVLCLNIQRREWLAAGVVIAGAAHALIGLYTFFGGSGALHLLINDRFFRAFGTFGQPNPFGAFMGLTAPLAVALTLGYAWRTYDLFYKSNRIDRLSVMLTVLFGICALLISAGVIASWSRGAWLGFGASLAVVAVMVPRRWMVSVAFAVMIAVGGSVIWAAGLLPASITERIASATQDIFVLYDVRGVDITPENYAIVERLAHWQAALNMAEANPWLGVGFGNYEIVYNRYRLLNWRESLGHAHNYYLNVLAETGIIGLLAYATLWISVIWVTYRSLRHPDTVARLTSVGLLGTWTYLLLHSLTDNLYVNNMFLHLGVMFGIVAITYNQTRINTRLQSR